MRNAKAESAARERGRPVEPAPGNAGEGNFCQLSHRLPGPNRLGAMTEQTAFELTGSSALPNSDRVYIPGRLNADLRVPLREIRLNPTRGSNGHGETNEPVRVYDCSGPWGDPSFRGTVQQ